MPTSNPQHDSFPLAGNGHPRVRQFLALKRAHARRPQGLLALEGLWALRAARAAGVELEVLFVCPELLRGDESRSLVDELRGAGVLAYQVSERVARRIVERDGPDGLAGIARWRQPPLADVVPGPVSRIAVADRLELVGNLGTIVRSADGAGAAAVLAAECPCPATHPLVLKASMGAVFSVPVVAVTASEALAWLRRHGFRLVAADPSAPLSYREAHYGSRVAVVVGNERRGLGAVWAEAADVRVSIPMLGSADSLNVGHAAALLLYEALHQQCERYGRPPPPPGAGAAP